MDRRRLRRVHWLARRRGALAVAVGLLGTVLGLYPRRSRSRQAGGGQRGAAGCRESVIGTISSIHAHALMQPPLRRTLRERRRRPTTVSLRRQLQTHAKSLRAKESMERQESVYITDVVTDLLSRPLQVCRPCFSQQKCGPDPDKFALYTFTVI